MFFKFICYEHKYIITISKLFLDSTEAISSPSKHSFFYIENQIQSLVCSLTTGGITSVISMFSWLHILLIIYIFACNNMHLLSSIIISNDLVRLIATILICISEYGIRLTWLICLKHCRKYQLLQPGMILNSYLRTAKSLGTGKCQFSSQHYNSSLPDYLHFFSSNA